MSSYFWRNPLQQQVVLGLFRTLYDPEQPQRVLDVGVSTGEMTLTYAMLLRDEYGERWHERFPFTAIDNDAERLEQCAYGIYHAGNRLYQMPASYRNRYFREIQAVPAPFGKVQPEIKPSYLAIRKSMELWHQIDWQCQDFADFADPGPFALVFIQNTLLHLPANQSDAFLCKIHPILKPDGFLVCAGRPPGAFRTLHRLGFHPVPHDVECVYEGWIQRKHSKNPSLRLKGYDPADLLLAFKIGSIFQKNHDPKFRRPALGA